MESPPKRSHDPATKAIAVIDDVEDLAATLVMLLESEGYLARYAITGAAGLELVQRMHPDAVLLDYALADMTGGAVGNALRLAECPPIIKILMCTSTLEETVKAEFSSYDAFLPKPVKHQHLMQALDAAFATD